MGCSDDSIQVPASATTPMPRVGRSFSGSQSACSGCNLEFLLRVIPGNSSFYFTLGSFAMSLSSWNSGVSIMQCRCTATTLTFTTWVRHRHVKQSSVYWLWTTLALSCHRTMMVMMLESKWLRTTRLGTVRMSVICVQSPISSQSLSVNAVQLSVFRELFVMPNSYCQAAEPEPPAVEPESQQDWVCVSAVSSIEGFQT